MKNAPVTNGNESANEHSYSTAFTGTSNPRHLRALARLLKGPATREELDRVVGCSNSPALISKCRRRGLEMPCDRIKARDRDGRACRPGFYSLTDTDKRKVRDWLQRRGAG